MALMRATHVLAAAASAILTGLPTAGAVSSAQGVQKVIQMLTDMSAKGKQDMKSEQVAFAEFSTWCSQETASLKNEIKKNGEEIQTLTADIGKLTSDVQVLGKEIGSLDSKIAKHSADQKAETAQREADHSAYLEESKDYSESVDALDRAIDILSKQDYDRKGAAAALLQVTERERLPAKAKSLLSAFLGMMGGEKGDFMSYDAPEANGYEFQSGGIVAMLKKLKDDFSTKLGECQKEEMNSKHAYDMIVMDLTDSIENSQKEMSEKTAEKQRKAEKSASNKKQLGATSSVKVENENTLSATTTECEEKTLSFQEKQKLRGEELEAIEKAIEILSSPEVAGSADKYLSMAQAARRGTALAHLREDRSAASSEGIRRKVREFLAEEGQRLKSQRLGLLAEKLAADPFSKVKKLINSLLSRLLEEANQDAQHEGFCDTEMGKSKITRSKLSEEIDGLSAAIEDGKATILRLTESTKTLQAEIADLVKSLGEATEMRTKEKEQNTVTVKDAQAAQKAVAAATAVLKEFYAKALTATALLQAKPERKWGLKMGVKMGSEEWKNLDEPGSVDTGHKEGMQTFGETYQGQQDEEQYGVLGLLEVIMSDFANLEADTTAGETSAQKSYEQFVAESKKSQAVKERKVQLNTAANRPLPGLGSGRHPPGIAPDPQMICIIVVAGHNGRLEREISSDESGEHEHLKGVPKALLPASNEGDQTILGRWWQEIINTRQTFREVYLVTNADKYKHYERWATANDFPVENIVNDGTTTLESRLGSVADLQLVLRSKGIADSDVMVVAGDMLFSRGFDISGVQRFFREKQGEVAVYYDLAPSERTDTRGIVEVDPVTAQITDFHEKPAEGSGVTTSRHASVAFYLLRSGSLRFVQEYLDAHSTQDDRVFGKFFAWLISQQGAKAYGMKLPTAFKLIGQTSLKEYIEAVDSTSREAASFAAGIRSKITRRAYARIGLVGNPSDGFFGKTIAVSIENFWAEASIEESTRLRLVPHPLCDPNEFGSLSDLHGISRKEGYQGGLILLQATCKKFYEYCTKNGIALVKRNFTLRYSTNVPRQVGLAGSSAIVTAVLQCLMGFYGLTDAEIPKCMQPTFVLSVEMEELFIQAGLQDRVIQTYEGCMYMDFAKELIESRGYGEYQRLPAENLPPLWLAYLPDPSNSGKIHSDVKARWKQGENEVVEAMKTFAHFTDEGRTALENKDWAALGKAMTDNFALRRKVYGDACLGEANLKMIAVAQAEGVPAKFPGSGGAVVGMCTSEEQRERIKTLYEEKGYVFAKLRPHEPAPVELS